MIYNNNTTPISDFSNIKENEVNKEIKEMDMDKIKEIKEKDKNKFDDIIFNSKDIYEKNLRGTFYHKLNYIKINEKKSL